jgi:HNH endonuclease
MPGCAVGYDHCKLHHIRWWRNGGNTDLDNLIPLCSRHHGNMHNDGWVIELGPNRQLTLTLPDGTIHNTGPPTRHTA